MTAAYDSLRDFLDALDAAGQLITIQDEVACEPDLGAAGRAVNDLGETAPALLFEKIAGFHEARVALNVHGSWRNHALMLGLDKATSVKDQFLEFVRRYQTFPGLVEYRDSTPWQEIVIDDPDRINLYELFPVFRINRNDAGCFIDKGVVVSREPDRPDDRDRQNVGIYRFQMKGPRTLGLQPAPSHDLAIHLQQAEERGEDLRIAIAIGNDPIISCVAAMPILYTQSEYEMAGALRQKPYPVFHSTYTGLDVPWGAEIVLEGVVRGRVRETEGPFGEFTGHYSGGRLQPVVDITRVSFRHNPIFESLYIGMPWTELDYLIAINTSAPIHVQLKAQFPEVEAVNASYNAWHGGHRVHAPAGRRFCQECRAGRADDAARARIRQGGNRGGRDDRSVQSQPSDVGAGNEVQSGARPCCRARSVDYPARSRVVTARHQP